jgi:hypothetical protein
MKEECYVKFCSQLTTGNDIVTRVSKIPGEGLKTSGEDFTAKTWLAKNLQLDRCSSDLQC